MNRYSHKTRKPVLAALPARTRNFFLTRELNPSEPMIVRPHEVRWMDLPGPIVLVNGAFDMLHAAHMRLLFAAREKGVTLVCALDSDSKVRLSKGAGRPVLNFNERATALGYMPIDIIVEIRSDADMDKLMKYLQPSLRVLGEEYSGHQSRYKTPCMYVRMGPTHTSTLIKRILGGADGKD